jgi:DNA modification methylase
MKTVPRNTILVGDALTRLRELPAAAVDCVVTSPPYFQTRNYQAAGQLGLEPTIAEWTANLRAVARELARVLVPTGALWINVGDSFSQARRYGAPPKSLILAPERLALALAQDGWLVRNKVIWAKTNPLPSSVTDRLTLTYEVIFLLARSPRYFFDLDAIREPHRSVGRRPATRVDQARPAWAGPLAGTRSGLRKSTVPGHPLGKNPGDVCHLATRGYPGAHRAVFPEALVRRPILATCPEKVCTTCGQPWRREPTRTRLGDLVPCDCGAPTRPGLVLDPFAGTATTCAVAQQLGRDWLGIEINPDYVELARNRLGLSPPLEHAA